MLVCGLSAGLWLGASSCADAPGSDLLADELEINHITQAVGEPQSGFPSWEERLVFVLTNRARSDPGAEAAAVCGGGCATYPASKALVHDYNLARAARFQATSLLLAKSGLMHDSVCTLVSNLGSIYPASCDGSPTCACVGGAASCTCSGTKPYCTAAGGLTSTFDRIKLFGTSGSGENAAAGNSDPVKSFQQWVKSSGHWSNLNKSTHSRLGVGHYSGTGGCWKDFWVQAFGGGSIAVPKIPGGAHYPGAGPTGMSINFWANYYDPAGGKPQLATVNIGGTCHKLTLERGTDTNGTLNLGYSFAAAGCHKYYFYFRDSSGAVVTYPNTGSFGVGIGGTTCADYHASARPALGTGCGGCAKDADCADGNACTTDTCVGSKCQSAAISGCCTTNAQCDDKDPCTTDTCVSNKCQSAAISGCCEQDSECDDSSACTTDTCVNNKCSFTPISGCCTKDADCADNNPCTTETCTVPPGTCTIKTVQGCCAVDTDCDDADPCTQDTCNPSNNTCSYKSIAGPGCSSGGDAGTGPGPGSDAGSGSGDGSGSGSGDGAGGSTRIKPGGEGNTLDGGCAVAGGGPGPLAAGPLGAGAWLWLLAAAVALAWARRRRTRG